MLESRICKLNLITVQTNLHLVTEESTDPRSLQEIHTLRKLHYQLTRNNKVLGLVCPSKALKGVDKLVFKIEDRLQYRHIIFDRIRKCAN